MLFVKYFLSIAILSRVLCLVDSYTATQSSNPLPLVGVNLAGAEFGDDGLYHVLVSNPGIYGVDYVYPEPSGSASWFMSSGGFNIFRINIRWERIQRSLGSGSLDSTELSRLTSCVNSITNSNGFVILDIHNYARYNGSTIGQSDGVVTNTHFVNFWKLLASQFQSNPRVLFGIMNEPFDLVTETWVDTVNLAITGIRSTGSTNYLLVPGGRWTAAYAWFNGTGYTSNSVAMAKGKIIDTANRTFIEFHQYLDADYSGTDSACTSTTFGVNAIAGVTSWLAENGYRGFLAELGGGTSTTCLQAVDLMIQYMENRSDAWVGYTWWAAGPWWNSYFSSIEPKQSGSSWSQSATQYTQVLYQHRSSLVAANNFFGLPMISNAMSAGSIAGIVIGVVAFLVLTWWCCCKKSNKDETTGTPRDVRTKTPNDVDSSNSEVAMQDLQKINP